MRKSTISLLTLIFAPFAALAANEGVPSYYQTSRAPTANQASYGAYANQGYTKYVGQSGQKQIVGTNTYTYQVPRAQAPKNNGTMTTNGIAIPTESQHKTTIYGGYTRRFADFQFETGVNSILEWDDMIFNEITVGARHNFSLRNFDLFAYGQYSYGSMESGGLSMDYDLAPFDWARPYEGIFTISVGDQTGTTNHIKFGFGAHHIWDIAGWKLSPSIGYEIFKHDLKMSNHLYPNQGVYLPLMTTGGDYVYGDELGNYYSLPITEAAPSDWYQVCMSPEDIKLVNKPLSGFANLGTKLDVSGEYVPTMGNIPWGVEGGECVIIGGDGPIKIDGTTHIYNTTWSGFYVGLEVEKQMTLTDKLRFYVQFGMPKYSSEGVWPMRDDWQQNPSFLDEGDNGAYSYAAELEYNMRLSDRLQLSLKVDTNYFHVGKIGGKLYLAEYSQFLVDEYGQYILDDNDLPILDHVAAQTVDVSDSLKNATWQSFGLHIGVKFAF